MDDVFTPDERAVQRRAGFEASGAFVRSFMPDQHRAFFASLGYVFAALPDADGWPIATVLTGVPGFVESPTPTTLRIDARPEAGDPTAERLHVGGRIGLLGLDLSTRRRNRANGVVTQVDGSGFTVEVRESFGNCPQYIQRRTAAPVERRATGVLPFEALPEPVADLIGRSDTFFIASAARAGLRIGGLDVSHRGGRAGFVRVAGRRLSVPDFRGNRYYNTLGNIHGEPRIGLLFIDFDTGDAAHILGRAAIAWNDEYPSVAGAERVWHVDVERGWFCAAAVPLRWRFEDASRLTLATGIWSESPGREIERTPGERP